MNQEFCWLQRQAFPSLLSSDAFMQIQPVSLPNISASQPLLLSKTVLSDILAEFAQNFETVLDVHFTSQGNDAELMCVHRKTPNLLEHLLILPVDKLLGSDITLPETCNRDKMLNSRLVDRLQLASLFGINWNLEPIAMWRVVLVDKRSASQFTPEEADHFSIMHLFLVMHSALADFSTTLLLSDFLAERLSTAADHQITATSSPFVSRLSYEEFSSAQWSLFSSITISPGTKHASLHEDHCTSSGQREAVTQIGGLPTSGSDSSVSINFWKDYFTNLAPGTMSLPHQIGSALATSSMEELCKATMSPPLGSAELPPSFHSVSFVLDRGITDRLNQDTLFENFLAILFVLFHSVSSCREDILIATPTAHNRGVLGPAENVVLLRSQFPFNEEPESPLPSQSFQQFATQIQLMCESVQPHSWMPLPIINKVVLQGVPVSLFFRLRSAHHTVGLGSKASTEITDLFSSAPSSADDGQSVQTNCLGLKFLLSIDAQILHTHQIVFTLSAPSWLLHLDSLECLSNQLSSLICAFSSDPTADIYQQPIITKAEESTIARWNETDCLDFSASLLFHELFEEQVAKSPDAIAIVSPDGSVSLSYRQLDNMSSALAHFLQTELSVSAGSVVGICMERDHLLPVTLLAVLKAGAAYTPLEPEYPAERLNFLIEDAAIHLVIIQHRLLGRLQEGHVDIAVDLPNTAWTLQQTTLANQKPFSLLLIDHPCVTEKMISSASVSYQRAGQHKAPAHEAPFYVLYTSGSTGRPKGVLVSHQSIVNDCVQCGKSIYHKEPQSSRSILKTVLSFDAHVIELFWPLVFGASCFIAPSGIQRDVDELVRLMKERKVTHFIAAASYLQNMINLGAINTLAPQLRYLINGGEALPFETCQQLNRISGLSVVNMLGHTETGVVCSLGVCSDEKLAEWRKYCSVYAPVGTPIPNAKILVIDRYGRLCPIGTVGEMVVSGAGVALGYHARPDLTSRHFVPNSYLSPQQDQKPPYWHHRIYKSGDLCRFLPDGSIEFIGRKDFQVKIFGVRIELGEISSVLSEHPAIEESVAVVVKANNENLRFTLKALDQLVTSKSHHAGLVLTDSIAVCKRSATRGSTIKFYVSVHQDNRAIWNSDVCTVADPAKQELWKTLYDQTYSGSALSSPVNSNSSSSNSDMKQAKMQSEAKSIDIIGWNSSLTGDPIPAQEMKAWLEGTVERILKYTKHQTVLEIGCGTGMILGSILSDVQSYVGLDMSKVVIQKLSARANLFPHAERIDRLIAADALEFDAIPDKPYDTLILNSVSQYFINAQYLASFIKAAVHKVGDNATLFIGDVRNFQLLPEFHSWIVSHCTVHSNAWDLRSDLLSMYTSDKELVISPLFFLDLPNHLPQIKTVSILLKKELNANEMTLFRYDVVIHIQKQPSQEQPHQQEEEQESRSGHNEQLWLDRPIDFLKGESKSSVVSFLKHFFESDTTDGSTLYIRDVPNGTLCQPRRVIQFVSHSHDSQKSSGSNWEQPDFSDVFEYHAVEPAIWVCEAARISPLLHVELLFPKSKHKYFYDVCIRKGEAIGPEHIALSPLKEEEEEEEEFFNHPCTEVVDSEISNLVVKFLDSIIPGVEFHVSSRKAGKEMIRIARGPDYQRFCFSEIEQSSPLVVAYFTVRAGTTSVPTNNELRQYLSHRLPLHLLPSEFIILEALPRLINDKIDRKSLPSSSSPSSVSRPNVEPKTGVEKSIAKLIEDNLEICSIGLHDNLFELGLNSLSATKLSQELTRKFFNPISVKDVFLNPTVFGLANHYIKTIAMKRGESVDNNPLLLIRQGEDLSLGKTFFMVHAVEGRISWWPPLSNQLTEHTIYCFQYVSSLEPWPTVEHMAEKYIEKMREVQAVGPYFIGGFSIGNVIAYEIAIQLERAGESIFFVNFNNHFTHEADMIQSKSDVINRILTYVGLPLRLFPDMIDPNDQGPESWCSLADGFIKKNNVPLQLSQTIMTIMRTTCRSNETLSKICHEYQPRVKLFKTHLLLFRATEEHIDPNEIQKFVDAPLVIHSLPGQHTDLLTHPENVANVARLIREWMASFGF